MMTYRHISSRFSQLKMILSGAGAVFWMGLILLVATPQTALAADPVVCSASMPGGINFGTLDVLNTSDTDVSGSLNITCTSNVNTNYYVTVCFNIGDGQGPVTAGRRVMKNGANSLTYQLYSDTPRSQIWGSATSANFPNPVRLDFYLRKNRSYSESIPVYARLFGSQTNSVVGNYTDAYASPVVRISGELNTNANSGNCQASGEDAGLFSAFNVVAVVQSSCLVSATDLDFGTTALLSSAVTSTSGIQVQCTNKVPYQVGLSNGVNAVGSNRYMKSGVNTVAYGLFQNAAGSTSWNDSTNRQAGVGTGAVINHPVYGIVQPQPLAKAGAYLDTIQVNVSY